MRTAETMQESEEMLRKIRETERLIKIEGATKEDFFKSFRSCLNSEIAKEKSIVYIWKTKNNFSRVIGYNNIIYIGQTKRSFFDRYLNTKSLKIEEDYFERYYQHYINKHGAICIEIIPTINPKLLEWEKLAEYHKVHKEYPPLNRSIPNKPMNQI